MVSFSTPIDEILPVAPRHRVAFDRLDLRTVGDVVRYYPRRYEDRRRLRRIADLRVGDVTTVHARVHSVRQRRTRTRKSMIEARVTDGSGWLDVVWFNQAYMLDVLKPGQSVYFYGEVKLRRRLQMVAPEFEIEDDADEERGGASAESDPLSSVNMQRIVPVYPATRGLHQRALRRLIHEVCSTAGWDTFEEGPYELLVGSGPSLADAYRSIHFPQSLDDLRSARDRLTFEEYFEFASRLHFRRRRFRGPGAPLLRVTPDLDAKIRSLFPFELTADQDRAVREISRDLEASEPMYRLLQGDVGTGKTAVALFALLAAVRNGHQGAIMAPTEVLAEQHHRVFTELLGAHPAVRIALLTGSLAAASRRETLEAITSGEAHIVVGTHALIQDAVAFRSLGVAVVDEQHRFGVRERARLRSKGRSPHLLVMSATPIPRSLCQTVYGDLDMSILRERPAGRPPVKTVLVPASRRRQAVSFIRDELRRGRQAYFIYPLIEESEALDLPAAEEAYRRVQRAFPDFAAGLLHGRLSADEKETCLRRFRDNTYQILVSTVVVEVGIDVPNATVLFIEDASRFGLAQLHQLRGRVGRGEHPGRCLVGYGRGSQEVRQRLEVFARSDDGFQIADEDLRLRGPGDFLGVRQSGRPAFAIGNPFADPDGFDRVRSLAARFWSEPRFAETARRYLESHPEIVRPSRDESPES